MFCKAVVMSISNLQSVFFIQKYCEILCMLHGNAWTSALRKTEGGLAKHAQSLLRKYTREWVQNITTREVQQNFSKKLL